MIKEGHQNIMIAGLQFMANNLSLENLNYFIQWQSKAHLGHKDKDRDNCNEDSGILILEN